ncbi:hypothetical protein UNSWDHB_2908 [Dehalobacter sp. UNSWDHB]|nr:hypothetical protein DHBDCA_p1191 [Dehalobacter sp. DCA]EQB22776.1 hypothetical protein UNSWDHB_2908 [Dehalobacter sp. UNSWDHB]
MQVKISHPEKRIIEKLAVKPDFSIEIWKNGFCSVIPKIIRKLAE